MRELQNLSAWADSQRRVITALKELDRTGEVPESLRRYLSSVRDIQRFGEETFPARSDDVGTNE
jgi:hypothetical protein